MARVYHEGWLTEEGPVSRKVTRYDAEETKARRAVIQEAREILRFAESRQDRFDACGLLNAVRDLERVEKARGR